LGNGSIIPTLRAALVRVYDVKDGRSVGPWRKFAAVGAEGVPDGLKVASDGSVWVADAMAAG